MKNKVLLCALLLFPLVTTAAGQMASDRISDIRNTKHNFAATDLVELPGGAERTIKASFSNEVCVYCHTPHGDSVKDGEIGATNGLPFLWNRQMPKADGFTKYSSSSYDGGAQNLGLGSRMCLSCHDGTVAIGQVTVFNGRLTADPTSNFSPDPATPIPAGTDGYTSNLGTDLSNDHPIGFVYNSTLAATDGELQDPSTSALIGVRTPGGVVNFNNALAENFNKDIGSNPSSTLGNQAIALPLEPDAAVIATRPTADSAFLSVAASGQVECSTCHDPHIRSTNNEENIKFLRLHRFQKTQPTVLATGISEPDFTVDSDINCVACHKKTGWSSSVHAQSVNTYKEAESTKREFPSGTTVWEASCLNCHDPHTETGANWLLRSGADNAGKSAIEETCYECHGQSPIVNDDGGKALADIQTIDALSGHQSFDFKSSPDTQLHNIKSADFEETQQNLKDNRHISCSDCHNPHRILSNAAFDGSGESGSSLHAHKSGVVHSNKLSGSLNGTSGVMVDSSAVTIFEPYNSNPGIAYTELKGVVDQSGSNAADVVTKEYQVCAKCHSDYSDTLIGAIDATSGLKKANVAMEFSEAAVGVHPVVVGSNANAQPGKADITKTDTANFVSPFDQAVGSQTMYCSDCHNNNVPGNPQGPHGSAVNKLLVNDGSALCATCHKAEQYENTTATTVQNSGFSCAVGTCGVAETANQNNNLHVFHATKATGGLNVCTDCHVKVPHGWRNKALLADINEADPDGLKDRYYPTAKIDINDGGIPASGAWTKADCTAAGCH